MKKAFVILAFGFTCFLVSCNNDETKSTETTKDTSSQSSTAVTNNTGDTTRNANCATEAIPQKFTHKTSSETAYYCSGIQQGRPPEGNYAAGEQLNIHNRTTDSLRPWVIDRTGRVAQIESQLVKL